LKRVHLFEFEDYSWFPEFIRDGGTDFLGFLLKNLHYYKPVIPLLKDAIHYSKSNHIVDICSGSGKPIHYIFETAKLELTYTLTDKFPNIDAFKSLKKRSFGRIDFISDSYDILKNPKPIKGLKTLFTAAHHFSPQDLQTILKDSVSQNEPITIFDGGDKHLGTMIAILLLHPLFFILFTPFIKPFKVSRLLFTYFIPLIPMYAIWDGMISILRLHTPQELFKMAEKADTHKKFKWSYGKKRNAIGFSVTYLIGVPKSRDL